MQNMEGPINVYISYVDDFVGQHMLHQFQQFPSTYRIYGCTWDSAAAEKLNAIAAVTAATGGCAHVAADSGLCHAADNGADAVAADAAGALSSGAAASTDDAARSPLLNDSRGILTPRETPHVDTAPFPDDCVHDSGLNRPSSSFSAGTGEAGAAKATTSAVAPAASTTAETSALLSASTFFSRHDVAAARAALLACDWIIVELRQAQTVLEMVHFLQLQTSFVRPKRLVLLSSLMTWYATPALTADGGRNGEGTMNDRDGQGDAEDEEGSADDAGEAPYPPPPPTSLQTILRQAQEVARRAVVDAMRGDGKDEVDDGETDPSMRSREEGEGEGEGEGDDAASVGPAEVLTEDQYNRRVPHLQYMSWRDAERAVATAHHAKGLPLSTFVICSGLPYGGEEGVLEPLFRLAWSAQPEKEDSASLDAVAGATAAAAIPAVTAVLPLFGDGKQRVPLVHVQDLACFVRKLLRCPSASLPFPERRYLFATDGANDNSWASIVGGVNRMFGGRCAVQVVPPSSYPLYRDVDKFTLNLRVEAESMKALMERQDDAETEKEEEGDKTSAGPAAVARLSNTWVAKGGLHRHLRAVAHEFAIARGVSPLRIALVGPPLVGKTYLATRLARHYRLPCVSLDSVVAEYKAALQALRTRIEATKAAVVTAERTRRLDIKRRRVLVRQQREWDAAVETSEASAAGDGVAAAAISEAEEEEEEANDTGSNTASNAVAGGGQSPPSLQREVAATAFDLTSAEEEELMRFVQDWWAEQPQVQAWTAKAAEMERVLLLRLHPRPPTPDANPKKRAAGGGGGGNAGGGGGKKKANAGKDAQKSKEDEEELQHLKASLQNAPFQSRALALMLRWRLAQPDCRVQGFVLDGVPATLELARMVFAEDGGDAVQPPATEEEALRPRYAGEGATTAAGGAADKDGEEGGGGGAAGPAAAKELASDARLPDHVVVLQASDGFLLSRMRAMGVAAEQQQQQQQQQKSGADASSATAVDVETFQQDLQTFKREYEEATYSVLSYWECAVATSAMDGAPKSERSTEVHLVTVEGHEPLVPPPPPASAHAEAPMGDTEKLLQNVIIGAPHNFGQSLEEAQRDAVRQRCLQEEEESAHAALVAAQTAAESKECAAEQKARAAEDDALAELKKADLAELEARKRPMTRYLQERVLPLLHKGLLEVCAKRPEDPVDFLAEWLIRHNPNDDTICDL